jgi:hypothetical protein
VLAQSEETTLSTAGSNSSPKSTAAVVSYFTTKAFEKALQLAFLSGGQAQKRSDKARIVLGSLQDADPFLSLQVTKHGETRIKNCVKYELGDGWRLVTRQTDKTCTFLFVGDHEDTERWIEGHNGESIGVKDSRLIRLPGIGSNPVSRAVLVDHHNKPLVDMLDVAASDHLLLSLSPTLVRKFADLDGGCSAEELNALLALVHDPSKRELLQKVLCLLLEGNVDGAEAHIDLSMGRIAPVEEYDSKNILEVFDGEDVRRIRVGSVEYEEWIKAFGRRSTWHDWFLFLHPEQEAIVNADYAGVSQLSGVSGSGKTCVAVRRAMRLAKIDGASVLLLTLNRSLAGMLRQLVDVACADEAVRSRIKVTSFFELARDMLMSFEPSNSRHYEDVTWKLDEHVDEIFREYYRCWANNHDAASLLTLHKSLNARGVNGESYVRQEFDWIRSAVQPGARHRYLTLERKGRKFPIAADRRTDLLAGLHGWEAKMRAVGVIDYLGLTSALAAHVDKIGHKYTNILVDEAQDFGTTELAIVRILVPEGANDIFLCGDVAQTVLPKQRSVVEAGLANITRERIRRNYRNSREILAAAYELLKANLHEELFESGDLEVLDPKFANFSDAAPVALAAESLEEEIAFARNYVATHLHMGTRNLCIAFAGFSSRDVKEYALKCGVTSLDGAYDPNTDRLVFSDLEQTKGYEFDVLIVVNCCEHVLPARDAPAEEGFRDICKLYVAMTRAKHELVLSFHGSASKWLLAVSGTISMDHWQTVENLDVNLLQGAPRVLSELDPNVQATDSLSLTGVEFLYTSDALGLSPDAQEKLAELVDGKGLIRGGSGRRLKWATMGSLLADLNESRMQDGLLGPHIADEVRSKLGPLQKSVTNK